MITDKTCVVEETAEKTFKKSQIVKCTACDRTLIVDGLALEKLIYYKTSTKQIGPFCGKCAAKYTSYVCKVLNENTTKSQKRAARRAAYDAADAELKQQCKSLSDSDDLNNFGHCDDTNDSND